MKLADPMVLYSGCELALIPTQCGEHVVRVMHITIYLRFRPFQVFGHRDCQIDWDIWVGIYRDRRGWPRWTIP